MTAANHGMTLTLAVDHDGRVELADAMAGPGGRGPRRSAPAIKWLDEDTLAARLTAPDLPRPRPHRAHRRRDHHHRLPGVAVGLLGAGVRPHLYWPTLGRDDLFAAVACSRCSAPRTPLRRRRRLIALPSISRFGCRIRTRTFQWSWVESKCTGVVNLYRDQGVVLRTIKLGETDRIISFLTQGHGKVPDGGQGRAEVGEPLRWPAGTHQPRRAAVLPGP